MTTLQRPNIPDVAPPGFGSVPEFLVFQELERRGMQEGEDFFYQSRFFGVAVLGAIEADFIVPPDLAINVQGVFFHYERGIDQRARDIMVRAQIATIGYTLIFIDDEDIFQDVEFYVGEALRYVDHSRIARGFN